MRFATEAKNGQPLRLELLGRHCKCYFEEMLERAGGCWEAVRR